MLEQQSYELPAAGNAQDRVLFHTAVIPAPSSSFLFLSLHLLHCIPALRMEQSFHFCFNGLTSRERLPTGCLTYQLGRNTVKTHIHTDTSNGWVTSDNPLQTLFRQSTDKDVFRVFPLHRKDSAATDHKHGTISEIWGDFPALLLLMEQRTEIEMRQLYLSCTLKLLVWSTSLHLKVHNFKTLPLIKKVNIIRFGASKFVFFL